MVQGLRSLLIDAVQHGASVGFFAPLSAQAAARYWEQVLWSLCANLYLWIAEAEGVFVGSVQLLACEQENGRHRAEIQKLLVLQSQRGHGIASQFMHEAEAFARSRDRTLLVLDTQVGSPAESIYRIWDGKR